MKEKQNSHEISRRNFIKKSGTGIAGSYLLLSNLKESFGQTSPSQPVEREMSKYARELEVEVNGTFIKAKVEPATTLLEFIREDLKLTGTKLVCNHGECGGCTVVIEKKAVYACQMLALDANKKSVLTIEGLAEDNTLHKIQQAFIDKDGLQCGFCTPGQIMSAYALLLSNPKPTREEIKTAMSGNICRCSAYPKILESVEEAANVTD